MVTISTDFTKKKTKYDCARLNSGMNRQNLASDVRKATSDKLLTCTEVNTVAW